MSRFTDAQARHYAALEALTQDRPAHARYLDKMRDYGIYEVLEDPLPSGVSYRVATALAKDAAWCRQAEPPAGWHPSGFPGAYSAVRLAAARAAARRQRSQKATEECAVTNSLRELGGSRS